MDQEVVERVVCRAWWEVLAQEGDEALGRGTGGERLHVIALVSVGVVHHALHHHDALVLPLVAERANGRALHLQAQHLAHRRRKPLEDVWILDDLAPRGNGADVHPEGPGLG